MRQSETAGKTVPQTAPQAEDSQRWTSCHNSVRIPTWKDGAQEESFPWRADWPEKHRGRGAESQVLCFSQSHKSGEASLLHWGGLKEAGRSYSANTPENKVKNS